MRFVVILDFAPFAVVVVQVAFRVVAQVASQVAFLRVAFLQVASQVAFLRVDAQLQAAFQVAFEAAGLDSIP